MYECERSCFRLEEELLQHYICPPGQNTCRSLYFPPTEGHVVTSYSGGSRLQRTVPGSDWAPAVAGSLHARGQWHGWHVIWKGQAPGENLSSPPTSFMALVSLLTSLSFHVHICNMGVIIAPTFQGCYED